MKNGNMKRCGLGTLFLMITAMLGAAQAQAEERTRVISLSSYTYDGLVAQCSKYNGTLGTVTTGRICTNLTNYKWAEHCYDSSPEATCTFKIVGSPAPKWVHGQCKNDFDDSFSLASCIASQGVAYQWREKETYRDERPETQCVMVTPDGVDKITVMPDDTQCDAYAGIGYGRFRDGSFGGMACFKTRKTGERLLGRQPVAENLCPATSRNGTYKGGEIQQNESSAGEF